MHRGRNTRMKLEIELADEIRDDNRKQGCLQE